MTVYGIDVHPLEREQYTGTEWYLFHLIEELKRIPLQKGERVILYCRKPIERLGALPEGFFWRTLRWPRVPGFTRIRLAGELFLRPPEVFFQPAHHVPFCRARIHVVTTIHDVAFLRIPEVYEAKELRRQTRALRLALRRADTLLTVSETTRRDLEQCGAIDMNRVKVVPLGINPESFEQTDRNVLEKFGLTPRTYFFSISRLEKKKNIAPLIRAYVEYKKAGGEKELVLGGSFGYGKEEILAAAKGVPGVHFLGYVPEEAVASLMAFGAAYVFPSAYEGFGLPALEAMAARVPLLCNNTPALQEVAGDAALFADVQDVSVFAKALKEISDRVDLVEKGAARVQTFSWKATAEKTMDVLRNDVKV